MSHIASEIEFAWRGLTLAGTLHLPGGAGPHPATVMMQGSGPADRASDGYFPPIRNAFLDQSMATFSFDKPGCGASTGDWRDYGLFDRADQVSAALAVIRARPDVDADRVGVWGQSQGGWMAQILASRPLGLAFAIANSGPSIGVVEQDLYGCEHSMRAEGHSEPDIEHALRFIAELHEAAQLGRSYADIAGTVEAARSESWYGYAEVEDEADWRFGRILVQEDYQPMESLRQIACPFLAIYGGSDVLVPAWRSAENTGHALAAAELEDGTVVVFPSGDHRIRGGGEFVPGYLSLLSTWAAERVAVRSRRR